MNINEWINEDLPKIVNDLENSIFNEEKVIDERSLNLAGRNEICAVLDDILAAIFPNAFNRERVTKAEMSFFLGDILRHIAFRLRRLTRDTLEFHCLTKRCEDCDCDAHADRIVHSFLAELPQIRRVLLSDIQSALAGDPAAQSHEEILLSYPFVEAVATHRIAHQLWSQKLPIVPRIMSERAHSNTGIDIHPGATIDSGFFIDHGTGVVIGETVTIGKNVKIYQGVTLGALSPFDSQGRPKVGQKRHPDIEDDVIIYANATILGGDTVIGKGSIIGGNTWITSSVLPGSVVYRGSEQKATKRD